MKEIVFPRRHYLMWWVIAISWSSVFLPAGLYAMVAPTSVQIFITGILSVASSIFFLRIALYRYIVAADDNYIYFYHKGIIHKQIPWTEIQNISMVRFSLAVDLAINSGISAGPARRISEIYVHKKDGSVLSIPSLYFTPDNRRSLVNLLEERRKKGIENETQNVSN